MHIRDHDNMPVIYVSHQKKSFVKYRWCMYNRWQNTLIPMVSSSGMTYANVVSIPAEKSQIHMTYITTYLLSGAPMFNVAWAVLHMLRERIHVLRKRSQDIPRSPHPRCVVVASRLIDTQLLPHDRVCPQASLILRGRVQDSHHLVGGYLPSYLIVGALL
jgi:hypothetical protein